MYKPIASSLTLKILGIAFNALFIFLLSTKLAIEDFGKYTEIINYSNLFLIVAMTGGINLLLKNKGEQLDIMFSSVCFLNFCFITICMIFIIFLASYSGLDLLFLYGFTLMNMFILLSGAYLRSKEKLIFGLLVERYLKIYMQSVAVSVLFIFVEKTDLGSLFSILLFVASVIFFIGISNTKIQRFTLVDLKTNTNEIIRYSKYSSVTMLLTRIDIILIGFFLGIKEVAIYGLMLQLLNLFTAFEQSLNPVFVNETKKHLIGKRKNYFLVDKTLNKFTSLIIFLSLLIFILAYVLLEKYFLVIWSVEYALTANLLVYAMLGRLFLSIFGYAENIAMLIGIESNQDDIFKILPLYILLSCFCLFYFGLIGLVIVNALCTVGIRIRRAALVFQNTGYFPSMLKLMKA